MQARPPFRRSLLGAALALILALAATPALATTYHIFPGWTTFNVPRFDGETYPGFVCNNIAASIAHANDRGGSATFIIFSSDSYSPYNEAFPPITVPITFELWPNSGSRIETRGQFTIGQPGNSGSLTMPAGDVMRLRSRNTTTYALDIVNGTATMPGGEVFLGNNGVRIGASGVFNATNVVIRDSNGIGLTNAGGVANLANVQVRGHLSDGVRHTADGGGITITGASSFRDNFGSGIRMMANGLLQATGASFSGNTAHAVFWSDNAAATGANLLAQCQFEGAGDWLIAVQNGSFIQRLDIVDPVFTGPVGSQGALFVGNGGTGLHADGGGISFIGTGEGAAKLDLTPVVANGGLRFARIAGGDLAFVQCAADGISSNRNTWIDSAVTGQLGADVRIIYDRCYFRNGAGSYISAVGSGGAFSANILATNSIFAFDSAAQDDLAGFFNLLGNQTVGGVVRLEHVSLKASPSASGANTITGSMVAGNRRSNGSNFARGDRVEIGWSVVDSSGVSTASPTTAFTALPVGMLPEYPSSPNILFRGPGVSGTPVPPADTIIENPLLQASGPRAGALSEASLVATAQAVNSPYAFDIDNAPRPQPEGTTPDIGPNEIIGIVDTTPPSGTVVINGGDAFANSRDVVLTLAAEDNPGGSGVAQMRFANDGAGFGDWVPFATSAPWQLADEQGTRTVSAQFRDVAGNVSPTANDTIILDTIAPALAFEINGGAAATNNSSVVLAIAASDELSGLDAVRIANDGATPTPWLPYDPVVAWDLLPGEGVRTVLVEARDNAGNIAGPVAQSIVVDTTPPTVVLSSPVPGPTGASPILVEAAFSEPVTGFGPAALLVQNGEVSGIEGGPQFFDISITPLDEGEVVVVVQAGQVFDLAGNANAASDPFVIVFDTSAPTLEITSTSPDPTNASPIPLQFEFSKPVTGFEADDIVVSGGVIESFEGEGAVYTAELVVDEDGVYEVTVAAGAAVDSAGNPSGEASFSIEVDATPPTVVAAASVSSPTNQAAFAIEVEFSEPVFGFGVDAIEATGPADLSIQSGGDGDALFVVSVLFDEPGVLSFEIPAGAAQDAAGNASEALADPIAIEFDPVAPLLALSAPGGSPTNQAPILVEAQFTKPVSGFDADSLVLGNATLASFSGSGASYAIELDPTGADVEVTLAVDPAGIADAAGNALAEGASIAVLYDAVAPSVVLSGPDGITTNVQAFEIAVQFSEPVVGLEAEDFALVNAEALSLQGSAASYVLEVSALADGPVSVALPAGAAFDAAGNPSDASNAVAWTFDGTPPTVVLSSPQSSPTATAPITISAEFSEPVDGIDPSAIDLANAQLDSIIGGPALWTILLDPEDTGLVSIQLLAGAAQDAAGNPSEPSNAFSIAFDPDAPTLSITSTSPDPTNASPIPLQFEFSKPVTGFEADDIAVYGGVIESFEGEGALYTAELVVDEDGVYEVTVAAGAAVDSAGNPSGEASFSIEVDATPPTVVAAASVSSPTNQAAFAIEVEFSEPVFGFGIDAIEATGPAGLSIQSGGDGDALFVVSVLFDEPGVLSFAIPAGAAQDAAGNASEALADPIAIEFDPVAPLLVLSAPSGSPTNQAPILVEAEFTKPVSGFDADSLVLGNATLASFSGSGASYAIELDPTGADVEVTLAVDPAGIADAAGNALAEGASIAVLYDAVAPTVVLSGPDGLTTNVQAFEITVQFSEPVLGLEAADFALVNAEALSLQGSAASYVLEVSALADGPVSVALPAGAAFDAAGNPSDASNTIAWTFSGSLPTVVLSTDSPSPAASPIIVFAQFSKAVSGFDAGAIDAVNAVAGNVSGAGDGWQFELVPTIPAGEVRVSLPAAAAEDLAGNPSEASNELVLDFDPPTPTPVLTTTAPSATSVAPIPFAIDFGAPVTGFSASGIVVSNGSVASIDGVPGNSIYSFAITPGGDGPVAVSIASAAASYSPSGLLTRSSNEVVVVFDSQMPSAVVLPPDDETRAGTQVLLQYEFQTPNASSAQLYVRLPGGTEFNPTGIVVTEPSGTVAYTATVGANGWYGFALRALAESGSQEPVPAAPEARILLNTVVNGLFEWTIAEPDSTLAFPMTNDIDIIVEIRGAAVGERLSVRRFRPLQAFPPDLPMGLLNESLAINGSPGLLFDSADLVWPYDEMSLPQPANIDTVYQYQGNAFIAAYPVAPVDNTLQVFGIESFSDWFAGPARASAPDWGDLRY